jgi:hypothetical protein
LQKLCGKLLGKQRFTDGGVKDFRQAWFQIKGVKTEVAKTWFYLKLSSSSLSNIVMKKDLIYLTLALKFWAQRKKLNIINLVDLKL